MSAQAQKETLGFQTEVKQLMHLVVHSLYSNKEIFLRELISNASDAADKLRFEALANNSLYGDDSELSIRVAFDDKAKTITVTDNGIGMSREDVIANLGTIAKSGTREFLSKLTGDEAKDSHLIGQFGVGFYSGFIIADKVTVNTRKAGVAEDEAVSWISNGEGEYSIENISKPSRGTEVILHLKKEETDFLSQWKLESIIRKYSDHISWPIIMQKTVQPTEEEAKEGKKETTHDETINRAKALWTMPKSEVKDEDYKALYKHISHDFDDPMFWAHNHVEGKQHYTTLLYVPKRAPFDLNNREVKHGLKLFVKRVFIMDEASSFLPQYLRFVKGIVDSGDLPLNVSREILQDNKLVDTIRSANTKRIITSLEKLAKNDKETYQTFWDEFGQVLKEGPIEDFPNREAIAGLLRFSSTHTDSQVQNVSLDDYIARMKTDQDKIYYVTAETFNAAKHSPHLEIFRKKGIEVLLLADRVDEWLVGNLSDYKEKPMVSITKGELDLGKLDSESEKEEQTKETESFSALIEKVKGILEKDVKDVRITHRLTDSPACLVADEKDMGREMQRILQSAGQHVPDAKPIFEINPSHPIVTKLNQEKDEANITKWTELLYNQAILAEGGRLSDPAKFVQQLNQMLLELSQ